MAPSALAVRMSCLNPCSVAYWDPAEQRGPTLVGPSSFPGDAAPDRVVWPSQVTAMVNEVKLLLRRSEEPLALSRASRENDGTAGKPHREGIATVRDSGGLHKQGHHILRNISESPSLMPLRLPERFFSRDQGAARA